MNSQERSHPEPVPPVDWKEHVFALVAGITLCLCIFVTLPEVATNRVEPLRHAARSYLRSVGADQYWPMFVGEDWDIPELRIVAQEHSGKNQDVTGTLLQSGAMYRQVLDDRMQLGHMQIARNSRPEIMDSYAASLSSHLSPEIRNLRFEAVYRTTKPRKTPAGKTNTNVILLGSYTRGAEGQFEKN